MYFGVNVVSVIVALLVERVYEIYAGDPHDMLLSTCPDVVFVEELLAKFGCDNYHEEDSFVPSEVIYDPSAVEAALLGNLVHCKAANIAQFGAQSPELNTLCRVFPEADYPELR